MSRHTADPIPKLGTLIKWLPHHFVLLSHRTHVLLFTIGTLRESERTITDSTVNWPVPGRSVPLIIKQNRATMSHY